MLASRRRGTGSLREQVLDLFPALKTMLDRKGGVLSGGQQQQLAIARALVADPKLLFLAGARSYLDGCFEQRELSRLFVSGDAPPGFDVVMRRRLRECNKPQRSATTSSPGETQRLAVSRLRGSATYTMKS